VLVVVGVVGGVAAAVVDVVDVIAVRDRDVPAAFAVLVGVAPVGGVAAGLALVEVAAVGAMDVPVVDVVHVIGMRERHVPAALAVNVFVPGVFLVHCGCHRFLLWIRDVPADRPVILSNAHTSTRYVARR
jgi:hypothetical protein